MTLKTAIIAGICAYASIVSQDSIPLGTHQLNYPELPQIIQVRDQLTQEGLEIVTGEFNKAPTNLFPLNQEAPKTSPQWLARQVKTGGERGLRALIQGLRLSGISLSTQGETLFALEERSQGITLPLWRLQMLSSGDHLFANHLLSSYTKSLKHFYNKVSQEQLQSALIKDLQRMSQSGDEGLTFFASFVDQLSFRSENDISYLFVNPSSLQDQEKVKLSTLQMGLLALRLEAEYAVRYLPQPPKFLATNALVQLQLTGCSAKESEIVSNPEKVKKAKVFEEIFTITESDNIDNPQLVKKRLGQLNNFLKSHTGILKVLTADLRTTLIDGSPLVRTKTNRPGEKKNFELRFTPAIKSQDELNCLKTYAKDMGLFIKDKMGEDFLEGARPKLTILKSLDKKRLFFDQAGIRTQVTTLEIDKKGIAKTPIWGLPQEISVSSKAKPIMIDVPILVEVEIDILNFIEPDPSRSEDAVISALLEIQKASQDSKIRRKTVTMVVKDWIEAPQGQVTMNVVGHHSMSQRKVDKYSWMYKSELIDFNSTAVLNLTQKSTMNPGMPEGIPLPPGLPSEYALPSLSIGDTVNFNMSSNIQYKLSQGQECDPCRAEDGWSDIRKVFVEVKRGSQAQAESYMMFTTPLSINKKTKKIKSNMLFSLRNIVEDWSKSETGRVCPGSGTTLEPVVRGYYEIPMDFIKGFEMELEYEEIDGAAVVKKSYLKDFKLPVRKNQTETVDIPGTIELKFDMRIPLP